MDPKRQPPQITPPVKVVGFHVEGASPSPRPTTLADAALKDMSTSPSPVIIPPLFQGQREGPGSPVRANPSAPVCGMSGGDDGSPGLRPIRTSSLLRQDSGSRTPVLSPVSKDATPRVLPISPVVSAPSTLLPQQDVGAPTGPQLTSPRTIAAAGTLSGAPGSTAAIPEPAGAALGATSPFATTLQPLDSAGPKAAPPGVAPLPASQQVQQPQQQAQQQKLQRPVDVPPKKELTKAERRAIQEAQRAAKAAAKAEKDGAPPKLRKEGSGTNLSKQPSSAATKMQAAASYALEGRHSVGGGEAQSQGAVQGRGSKQRGVLPKEEVHATKSTELFAHLPPYRKITLEALMEKGSAASVPLEAVKVGLQYVDGSIRGANARCAAMLVMFMHVIKEFKAPAGKEVAKELLGMINGIISFLVACRPLSVTMGNAIKYIKCEVERLKLQPALSEQQAKDDTIEMISNYIQEKIRAADNLIVEHAIAKILDGDVILTYSHSTLVAAVLLKAHEEGRRFSVVVADARPHLEGRRLLRQLLAGGISCEYVYLNALSFSLDRVTKVLLGAGAVLSNGTVLSRVGSAAVAMMAAAERIPVLVCSETYKFHERVQLDSITQNELGDPEEVAHLPDWVGNSPLDGWKDTERLGLLNLKYDAMPADFVSVVVTEAGLIPPTSVAVILRESRQDIMV